MTDSLGAAHAGSPSRRRWTGNRRELLDVLGSSENFRSAQQIHRELRQYRSLPIGLTTVYRILRSLVDDEIAETQRAEEGEVLYRLRTTNEHRHYLVCRRCGRAVGFTAPAFEEHTSQLGRRSEYTDITHYFDLYGVCPRCRDTPSDTESAIALN
ncbi:Fur family transcriptional regulator [Mycobacterium sp. LTG2003]